MKTTLRFVAALLALATLAFWLAGGANRGWTQTSRAVERTDEITGLSYREYEPRFTPGVDLLAVGLAGAALVAGLSMWIGSRKPRAAAASATPDRPA